MISVDFDVDRTNSRITVGETFLKGFNGLKWDPDVSVNTVAFQGLDLVTISLISILFMKVQSVLVFLQ